MQRSLQLSRRRELGIELGRGFERIGHRGIVVGLVRLRPLAAQIERDERVDLAGVRDRFDVAELLAARGIDRAAHARAVIGFDALQVVADQLRGGELASEDRAVNVGDGGFLQVKPARAPGARP